MTHDENIYENPFEFIPERFLGPSAEEGTFSLPFGFGRRACPGQHLADSVLFIYMASILSVMNISKAKDANGKEVTPEVRTTTGLVWCVFLDSCRDVCQQIDHTLQHTVAIQVYNNTPRRLYRFDSSKIGTSP